ncbi:MAG: phosphoglycerate dehydrogenase [Deltaproteobacteria bacterium]|nr:phosphoglycerate dehydrogenase [Deltaproteobacteria bacterium]
MTFRVLLLESIHELARINLAAAGIEVELMDGALTETELAARLEGVHAVGIRSKTQMTARVIEAADDLMAIGAFCIGTNQIDLDMATERGVAVFNAPFSNTRSVAELVLSEIVMLSRGLADRSREMHVGQWRKTAKGAREVRGKTLGIIGYGHIGHQIGIIAESFGMRVVFHDIVSKLPIGNNTQLTSLEAVLRESDFVSLHVPATDQTHEMIGANEIAQMKPGAALLNLSRGTVVVIPALAEALKSGHLSGAAIDVFPVEPKKNISDDFVSDLRGLENVVMTPHIGGSTMEAQENIGREVSTALANYFHAGGTTGSVNFPEVELPKAAGAHRITNVHQNVPGVLSELNRIVSEAEGNVTAQVLATQGKLGYLLMDFDQAVADDVAANMNALETTLVARAVR